MFGLKLRETNILKIIEESLAKLSRQGNVDIKLKKFLENDVVWIDYEQMVTALFDLEKNAIEAMPDGGSLIITVEGDEHQVSITLADTGVGIAEENIPLLFTPFFTTKPAGDGTGLGLPSAYAAVKAYRGNVTIESNADPKKGPTGTTVRIALPRRQIFQAEESKMIVHEED
ncbi:MAG: HAMP domain-containing sensor histidine kinase [Smithellaceae bacterium]|nr:HAMP domain-containing sensor histidine kinase [Smithellaceae bacterium]